MAECIKLVNLPPETVDKFPAELSGGMRKRVGIARAIAGSPKYLLYDEPTSGLDPVNADVIDELVRSLAETLGVTGVMVTHDVRGAFRTANRLALLTGGQDRPAGHAEGVSGVQGPARCRSSSSATSTTPSSPPEPFMDLALQAGSHRRHPGHPRLRAVLRRHDLAERALGGGTDSDKFYKIQFRDASNLKASSPVRISGVGGGQGREDQPGRRGQGAGRR